MRSLVQAAQKAGYPQWWLAEQVAESVTCYLRSRFDDPVVALPKLTKAVQAVLQVIGYAEVAKHFVPGPPPVKISLPEIVREAGPGYELAFFGLFGGRSIVRSRSERLIANFSDGALRAAIAWQKNLEPRLRYAPCRDCCFCPRANRRTNRVSEIFVLS